MPRKIFILLFGLLLAARGASGEEKAHSTSTSRQFIVYGADVRVRGAFCDLAERTKAAVLRLLALPDRWTTPLVMNLDFPQANLPELAPSRLEFSQTGSGLKLQLNLLLTDELNGPEVQRDLLRAILIEMIYRERTNVAAGTAYAVPPDWLLDGMAQLVPGHDAAEAAQLLATMVEANTIAPLDEVVRQRRDLLDPASQKLHDAYSMVLVQLLLETSNGANKLLKYLQDLPEAPNDPVADLRAHFPNVLGASANKWWSLSVARLSAHDRYEILSAAATAKRLDQLLQVKIRGTDGKQRDFDLADFSQYLKIPGSRAALLRLSREFLILSTRAHPSYRSIVQECYQVTAGLARGKTKDGAARLTRVTSYRALVESQAREMDDFLNWFEATQLKTMSGAFSQILKAANDGEEKPPRRRDPISVYLDSIEANL